MPMRQQLEERLATLRGEYDKGQTRIRQLEEELTSLRETMLRISGAILVLEELLSPPASAVTFDSRDGSSGAADQVESPTPTVHGRNVDTKKEL